MEKVFYHIPGLFEFYDLYKAFLPLWRDHREYFYDWCEIGSIYGAPSGCLWGGGRVGFGDAEPEKVAALVKEYGISARLTFSNSLIREEHLADVECNALCKMFESADTGLVDGRNGAGNGAGLNGAEFDVGLDGAGIIVHSDLLLDYIRAKYPGFYFISSTTKVITDFGQFVAELNRDEFRYVVPDFRLNRQIDKLSTLTDAQKQKVEFLCNECCWFGCHDRKACYENVSRKSLGENCEDHVCVSPTAQRGYRFSDAMKNPGFIGIDDIRNVYAPAGFRHFKIEGRSLGSALILEFLLYYMTKPEHQLKVREEIYLDSSLDLF
ncbi:hypothetical protein SAMN05720472_2931 [Fibrobacter sp. UWR3]|uniref:hypothetical protein n=1 Tax=Fibrobacter sp. UWR3 TaxID=1896217 RepID=UPI00091E5350|nr:hypothetical protein [Fibrobacter sp. UWR3]SHN00034.1 hypothetical protein SAMN05720472_2931 [Fibrobacter sp. UWR3]